MSEKGYQANYYSALSYRKVDLKEEGLDCLKRAYSQIPEDHKTADNRIYLHILSYLGVSYIELSNQKKAKTYIEEGLKVKQDHMDYLFLNAILLLDEKRYDEMLEAIIHFLLAVSSTEIGDPDCLYAQEVVVNEVYENLLPTAYRLSSSGESIRKVVEKLSTATKSPWIQKALGIMDEMDHVGSKAGN